MFAVQLLTLALGLVSIRFDRRNLLLTPFLFSLVVAVLMTYVGQRISGDVLAISTVYQVGYYLVYPSIATFLFAFLLREVTRKRERARAETEALRLSHL
jgi:small basic protein